MFTFGLTVIPHLGEIKGSSPHLGEVKRSCAVFIQIHKHYERKFSININPLKLRTEFTHNDKQLLKI
jgi:hypothetical protein